MPAAKVPPAPARFSTTNGWPNSCESACAKGRATISVVPPGAKGTISVTGLLGHTCAKAPLAASVNKMQKDPNKRTTMLIGALLEVRRDAFSRCASPATAADHQATGRHGTIACASTNIALEFAPSHCSKDPLAPHLI